MVWEREELSIKVKNIKRGQTFHAKFAILDFLVKVCYNYDGGLQNMKKCISTLGVSEKFWAAIIACGYVAYLGDDGTLFNSERSSYIGELIELRNGNGCGQDSLIAEVVGRQEGPSGLIVILRVTGLRRFLQRLKSIPRAFREV